MNIYLAFNAPKIPNRQMQENEIAFIKTPLFLSNVKYIIIQTRNMDANEISKKDKNENKSV